MPAPLSPQDRAAQRAARAERREAAVKLAAAGNTYVQVAAMLGYNSAQAAHRDVKAALQERLRRQDLAVDEMRMKHTALLDEAIQVAYRIMNAQHLAHSAGRVVQLELANGDVIEAIDYGPNLAAASKLRELSESQRKLWGIDAPTKTENKHEVDGTVAYQVAVTPEELEQL